MDGLRDNNAEVGVTAFHNEFGPDSIEAKDLKALLHPTTNLKEHAQKLGADYLATGHYVRSRTCPSTGETMLLSGSTCFAVPCQGSC